MPFKEDLFGRIPFYYKDFFGRQKAKKGHAEKLKKKNRIKNRMARKSRRKNRKRR